MEISDRINELKTLKKYSQKDLAKIAGVSNTAIGTYEKGTVTPPTHVLVNIAKACNVSMDWLCGLSDVMNESHECTTVADVIKAILLILTADGANIYKVDDIEEFYSYDTDDKGQTIRTYPEGPNSILFSTKQYWDILQECKKVNDLYEQGLFDDKLYSLWQEKILDEYKDTPIKND